MTPCMCRGSPPGKGTPPPCTSCCLPQVAPCTRDSGGCSMTWPPPAPRSSEHPGHAVIEAEIKARVHDVQAVRDLLRARAAEQVSDYHDTYYDLPGQVLTSEGRELRVRVIETGERRRCLLTCKGAAVDEQTGSKPETETEITDPGAMDQILLALGFTRLVAFDKHCV